MAKREFKDLPQLNRDMILFGAWLDAQMRLTDSEDNPEEFDALVEEAGRRAKALLERIGERNAQGFV